MHRVFIPVVKCATYLILRLLAQVWSALGHISDVWYYSDDAEFAFFLSLAHPHGVIPAHRVLKVYKIWWKTQRDSDGYCVWNRLFIKFKSIENTNQPHHAETILLCGGQQPSHWRSCFWALTKISGVNMFLEIIFANKGERKSYRCIENVLIKKSIK